MTRITGMLGRIGVILTIMLPGVFGVASSASAEKKAPKRPDTWLYCSNTVPTTFWGIRDEQYAGIVTGRNNSINDIKFTYCKDLVINTVFFWYKWRPVDWNAACRMTYGDRSRAYNEGGYAVCS